MKKLPFHGVKIDWPNHLIGFFSALFGILIAFELDGWRERQNQKELVANALERMKVEIDFNQQILHSNLQHNVERVKTLHQFLDKLNNNLLFIGSLAEADSVNKYASGYLFINTDGSSENSESYPANISVSSMPMISHHTSAWESAKATGVLNFMGYEKVLLLSSIYNYTNILDELTVIRQLVKKSSEITTKTEFMNFLLEMEESLIVIERELTEYDQFVNMVKTVE